MWIFKNKLFSNWAEKEGLGNKAFFVYGFAKNVRANISPHEIKALKFLVKELLSYTDKALTDAIEQGVLIEVKHDG